MGCPPRPLDALWVRPGEAAIPLTEQIVQRWSGLTIKPWVAAERAREGGEKKSLLLGVRRVSLDCEAGFGPNR